MFRAVQLKPGLEPLFLQGIDKVSHALSTEDGFVWVSLEAASEEEINSILGGVFKFHPLAIEDCLSPGYQVAKIDDFSDYIFLITHAIKSDERLDTLEPLELDFFLGENFLVTCFTDAEIPAIEKTWERIIRDNRISKNGADFFCHTILDEVVDEYMPLIDSMETEVEWIEDSAMEKPTPATLQRLLSLKHSIMSLRRIIAPQREVMNRLSRDEFPQIDAQSLIYFRDIYDHLSKYYEVSETAREQVTDLMEIHLSLINNAMAETANRTNAIMRRLTLITTIFMPLTLISGIGGMSEFTMIIGQENWKIGYAVLLIVMAVIAFVNYLLLLHLEKDADQEVNNNQIRK